MCVGLHGPKYLGHIAQMGPISSVIIGVYCVGLFNGLNNVEETFFLLLIVYFVQLYFIDLVKTEKCMQNMRAVACMTT
jgi:hypothetical protein